ncbi:PilN domain-containing protein [Pseudidiomarina sp.]|uniref:PilN domain-containing protein n=1 Tax=Pseudidiomarina sp. TaxID=2081707 RepID=UPI00299F46E9|nr:PilN domain-containing protein [Pseudidiomarina sp.]MDX1706043.1 PilN domain-containing protein [Pseudidiomarina sp.]
MAHVNLLPWRESARQRAKNLFAIHAVLAIGCAAIILFIAYTIIGTYQEQQQRRNQFLQGQIQVLDAQIAEIQDINNQKDEIVSRMKLIQSLHQDRNTAILIFNELARRTPEGVHLLTAEKNGMQLSINGRTVSNNRVAEFLRELKNSEIFSQPELREVVADRVPTTRGAQLSAFSLVVSITPPAEPEEVKP